MKTNNPIEYPVLRMIRDLINWEGLDMAHDEGFTLDFIHRGSTMRITIGPA